jgi:hypothetical protein
MSTIYKYYLNGYEYTPTNTGGFTFDYNLNRENGAYHFSKSVNGSINFNGAAYDYILSFNKYQKIELTIKEFCPEGEFLLFNLYFTHFDCNFSPDEKRAEVSPKQDTLYQCLTDNYDREYNFLEATNVVSSVYSKDFSKYEYKIETKAANAPFFGSPVYCGGVSPFFAFYVFVRELKTTYCQGGEPQAPPGAGWQILFNNCSTKNLITWYRKPPIFDDPAACSLSFTDTVSAGPGLPPPPPAIPGNWFLMGVFGSISTVNIGFWIDTDTIPKGNINLDNGRLLLDVINQGLNEYCPELDLQSNFLTNTINPVTGETPSPTEGVQIHAISDIKDPAATEPATRELITLQSILNDYISSKFNCFWRIDEGTKRLIIEHYNDLTTQGVTNLTQINGGKWTKLKNKYSLDNSDLPKAEAFPSLDNSIDFTGVNITYNSFFGENVKTYNTDKYYSEIETIISDPDEYPADGVAMITPESLAPDGLRAKNGAITGDYRPNVPQGMANLHANYWPYYRPFDSGSINFTNQQFNNKRPVKILETVTVPVCCFFLFAPYSRFVGNNFSNGQLRAASFNPKSGFISLEILY